MDKTNTPTLYDWANRGVMAELTPTFPCVTSSVQATMLTGLGPDRHGVIANGFFRRDRAQVEFWVGPNSLISGEQIWDTLRRRRAGCTSAVWHAQNIKGAGADFIVTPAPIHEPDGSTKLWCFSKPEGLYEQLLSQFGHFPLQHYWGPMANIESTRWILRAAGWLHRQFAPNFHWVYIPHLDYAAQKFGPNSPQARNSLVELDRELAAFVEDVAASPGGDRVVFLVVGEYALTNVHGVIFPNRWLRQARLIAAREQAGKEYLDLSRCSAFAMVDHQFAHVYVRDPLPPVVEQFADLFRRVPGIAGVYAGSQRREVGLEHPRSGEIILVAQETHWFAYYWWFDDAAAPPFARTVDIHQKPGYDPVELFFDPATRGIPLDPDLVKGSHGVPATAPHHHTALICSSGGASLTSRRSYRDADVHRIVLDLLTA